MVYFHAEGDPSLLPPDFHMPVVVCPNATSPEEEEEDDRRSNIWGISLVFFCLIAIMVSLRTVRPK